MTDLLVREAQPHEFEALAKIHQEVLRQGWNEKSLQDLAATSGTEVLAAYLQNEIAGFAVVRVVLDEAEILAIAVARFRQKQGVGTALMEMAGVKTSARGANRISLEVSTDNVTARAFYEKFGFRQVGFRKAYYQFPTENASQNALVLQTDLPFSPNLLGNMDKVD